VNPGLAPGPKKENYQEDGQREVEGKKKKKEEEEEEEEEDGGVVLLRHS